MSLDRWRACPSPLAARMAAVVIALACRNLSPQQRRLGILWGTAGAIALRVLLIFFALSLLQVPGLKLTGAVLLIRAALALSGAALPGRWSLVGVLVLTTGLTFWSYGSLLGKEPGVAMAVALMAIKTLELRARRDAFVVFFLGFFLILTQFL